MTKKVITEIDKVDYHKQLIVEQLKGIPKQRLGLSCGLIDQAAWFAAEIEKLQAHVSKYGVSEEYKNGANQTGKKPTPESQTLARYSGSYQAIMKQLIALTPKDDQETDPFAEFDAEFK